MGKYIHYSFVTTKEDFEKRKHNYDDLILIPTGEAYWSDSKGIFVLVTSQEYKDYLLNKEEK